MSKYIEYHNRLKDQSLCQQCKKPIDREGYYCSSCLQIHNERHKEEREFFKSLGICVICHFNKSVNGTTYCEDCSQKLYEYNRKRFLNSPDYIREHNRISNKKRYYECKEQGICTRCRKRKADYGKTKCKICLDKDALRHKYKFHVAR